MRIYKINDKIEKNEIEEVSKKITKKAIKVIASNGDKIAIELLENKHKELFEDITQEVALQLILNNYTITKECYRIVRSYIYKKNRDIIELIVDDDDEEKINELEKKCYINYISNEYKTEQKTKTLKIEELGLTSKQIEILKMSQNLSFGEVAKLLNVSKSTVSNTIYRIRQKLQYLEV